MRKTPIFGCICPNNHMKRRCDRIFSTLNYNRCVELDLYPVEALTTCNHALAVCNSEPKCIALFDQFKADCKVRDKKCRMDSRERCFQSWKQMRKTPIFGCICPNNHMKRRCDRIFSTLNYNRC
ncbi:hypothetical protein FOCC_FOCC004890, partial [Frankliniella occidentalis]